MSTTQLIPIIVMSLIWALFIIMDIRLVLKMKADADKWQERFEELAKFMTGRVIALKSSDYPKFSGVATIDSIVPTSDGIKIRYGEMVRATICDADGNIRDDTVFMELSKKSKFH